ncbi:MAG: carbon monoxide dehydrogenase subunit G [Pseudomonadota bacterium]
MKLAGERLLNGGRDEVWAKLNDPEVLKRCIPGCESLEQTSPTDLKATVALKIGPMNARFNGDVTLKDLNPPESYRIEGSGTGGAVGRATGGANVLLAEDGLGTKLTYDVDANVSGKIAQLGQRLIDSTAKSLANKFFDAFAAEFEAPDAAQQLSGETGPAAGGKDQAAPVHTPPSGDSSRWLWYMAGAIALALGATLIVQLSLGS